MKEKEKTKPKLKYQTSTRKENIKATGWFGSGISPSRAAGRTTSKANGGESASGYWDLALGVDLGDMYKERLQRLAEKNTAPGPSSTPTTPESQKPSSIFKFCANSSSAGKPAEAKPPPWTRTPLAVKSAAAGNFKLPVLAPLAAEYPPLPVDVKGEVKVEMKVVEGGKMEPKKQVKVTGKNAGKGDGKKEKKKKKKEERVSSREDEAVLRPLLMRMERNKAGDEKGGKEGMVSPRKAKVEDVLDETVRRAIPSTPKRSECKQEAISNLESTRADTKSPDVNTGNSSPPSPPPPPGPSHPLRFITEAKAKRAKGKVPRYKYPIFEPIHTFLEKFSKAPKTLYPTSRRYPKTRLLEILTRPRAAPTCGVTGPNNTVFTSPEDPSIAIRSYNALFSKTYSKHFLHLCNRYITGATERDFIVLLCVVREAAEIMLHIDREASQMFEAIDKGGTTVICCENMKYEVVDLMAVYLDIQNLAAGLREAGWRALTGKTPDELKEIYGECGPGVQLVAPPLPGMPNMPPGTGNLASAIGAMYPPIAVQK